MKDRWKRGEAMQSELLRQNIIKYQTAFCQVAIKKPQTTLDIDASSCSVVLIKLSINEAQRVKEREGGK